MFVSSTVFSHFAPVTAIKSFKQFPFLSVKKSHSAHHLPSCTAVWWNDCVHYIKALESHFVKQRDYFTRMLCFSPAGMHTLYRRGTLSRMWMRSLLLHYLFHSVWTLKRNFLCFICILISCNSVFREKRCRGLGDGTAWTLNEASLYRHGGQG